MENDTVLDHGITLEEHLLYLASTETHCRHLLRNAALPRVASISMVRELENKGYLKAKPIFMSGDGSIAEYSLTYVGKNRLVALRQQREIHHA